MLLKGMVLEHPGNMQRYVDDPAGTCIGRPAEIDIGFDVIILWWWLLGIPLALRKGVREHGARKWIGAIYQIRQGPFTPEAPISVPPAFAAELANQLRPFAAGEGHVGEAAAEKRMGRAGRLAYIIPTTRPYMTALWGALAGARAARAAGKREAPQVECQPGGSRSQPPGS